MTRETRRPVRALRTALIVALVAVVGGLLDGTALAAPRTVTMAIDDSSGTARLVPSALTVSPGDRVVFRNDASTAYTVAVSRDGYKAFLVPNQSSDGAGLDPASYTAPKTSGPRSVTLTSVTGAPGQSGTITVAAPASPTPSPSTSRTPAAATSTPPKPGASRSATQTPALAPVPSSRAAPPPAALPPAALPTLSVGPLVTSAPPVRGSQPLVAPKAGVPTPDATQPVAVGGPLEAPSGRGVGLPAALAAVLIAGGVGALLRVLLAEPVDRPRRTVGVTG